MLIAARTLSTRGVKYETQGDLTGVGRWCRCGDRIRRCGFLFSIAAGPTAAVVSWVLHIDVTGMQRSISIVQLVVGLVLVGGYVGLIVGLTAALYNRLVRAPTAV